MILFPYMGGIEWSQREGSILRPADYEPTGLAFQLTDNNYIGWAVKMVVLRLCSPAVLLIFTSTSLVYLYSLRPTRKQK